ncbi:MAG: hypothetical protein UU74_C0033G0010 [Candidatus Woesebacteria bacterium GW2011_GWA1_41_7]|uniref:Uncharacterized protein n=1 Tax=Candidatus Woesebacteria bacterium GW2011_GWA1_41_7 TaxID=1618556 RepID=A0A0G0ZUR1_9BACT|nr:MAG: hypothetical protein UU74_C0033G0010 [Candidatus Woesebacteria bacterium GW2011_GWA1_41_7]
MFESKFKTARHIETVRNFLNSVIRELLRRGECHDQSKLQVPEVEVFAEYTAKLRNCTYGSEEYKGFLQGMQVALDHHYANNSHHPEYFTGPCIQSPLERMTLVDLFEMLCDWKAASLRHVDGDIFKSIEINQQRFGYSDEVRMILMNTAQWLNTQQVEHFADES